MVNGRVVKRLEGGRVEVDMLTFSQSSDAVNIATVVVRSSRLARPVRGLIQAPNPLHRLSQTRGTGTTAGPVAQQGLLPLASPLPTKAPPVANSSMGPLIADIREAVRSSGLIEIAHTTGDAARTAGSAARTAGSAAGRAATNTGNRIRDAAVAVATAPGRATVTVITKTSPVTYATRTVVGRVQSEAADLPRAAENTPEAESPTILAEYSPEPPALPSSQSLPQVEPVGSSTVVRNTNLDNLRPLETGDPLPVQAIPDPTVARNTNLDNIRPLETGDPLPVQAIPDPTVARNTNLDNIRPLETGDPLPVQAIPAPTVAESGLADELRREERFAQESLNIASTLLARASGNLNPLPPFYDDPSDIYERAPEWLYSYDTPGVNRSPQSIAAPTEEETPEPEAEGWFARLKRFFGLDDRPYAPKKGDRISFRNWLNFGGLSNARIAKDEGEYARLAFPDPWRGIEREISVAKNELYHPLGTSLGHIKPGDRVSIPAPFWRRRNGTVVGIKGGKVQVGSGELEENIHYEWVFAKDVADARTIEEER